ncbi:MAG: hypothetical protein J2P17_02890, partial [Mycobacterium sp.]|nr:hypothetical protein [Mycobacterium sp.]
GMQAAPAGADAAREAARAVLSKVPAIDVDYLRVRGSALEPAPAGGCGRLLLAARLGKTRLIDNIAIEIGTAAGVDWHLSARSDGHRPAGMPPTVGEPPAGGGSQTV